MCLEKVETIMTEYELIKKKVKLMHSDTLKKTLMIMNTFSRLLKKT